MATLDDFVKGWGKTAMLTVGAVMAAPALFPQAGAPLRPLAKRLLKGSFTLADRTRELIAETGEHLSDLIAEARYEYTRERTASPTPPAPPPAASTDEHAKAGAKSGRATRPLYRSPETNRTEAAAQEHR